MDFKTGGTVHGVIDTAKILRIDSTSLATGTGNQRLSAVDGNVFLKPYEKVVLVSCATATGSYSVYLPDALACIGEIVTITCAAAANSKEVTVKDAAGNDAVGDALAAANDVVVLLSVGVPTSATLGQWIVLKDTTT